MSLVRGLREGYTTGSCAAAAAKAAAMGLLTGDRRPEVEIELPSGDKLCLEVYSLHISPGYAFASVIKDSGDDPDVTDGMEVCARVSRYEEISPGCGITENIEAQKRRVIIEGGEGVGRITMPGLDQPVGAAAINSVPRRMIENSLVELMDMAGYAGSLEVIISIPGGEERALETLNPDLGIEGGLSVLGTSGIVRPMSRRALLDTIALDIGQKLALFPEHRVLMTPGGYGLDFLRENYGISSRRVVRISNFLGQAVDLAAEKGAPGIILAGHIGKMVKLSGGIMNTHSREADSRMELMSASALMAGAGAGTAREILSAVTTEAALDIMDRENILEEAMNILLGRALKYLRRRAGEGLPAAMAIFSNNRGLLSCSEEFPELISGFVGGKDTYTSVLKQG